jgi:hypothetical protein
MTAYQRLSRLVSMAVNIITQPLRLSAYQLIVWLQGFVAAVPPFNFTAIGANLGSCPAIMVRLDVDRRYLSWVVIFCHQ